MYFGLFVNLSVVLLNIRGIFQHQKKKINYDPVTNIGDITGEILVVRDLAYQIVGFVLSMGLLFGVYIISSNSFEVMVL